ncbi:MAG TPA: TIM barrel protein [Pirellulaceae bacterium]|jgi:sugar phosphate isomerase/epimerase|nr:TIM barrel protein [Pirellulaceae bacterium]
MKLTRRRFNELVVGTLVAPVLQAAEDTNKQSLVGEVGVTTSSFSGHLVKDAQLAGFTLLELPRILREELDMRVIDLNTSSLASQEPDYLDQCRAAAEKAGCVFTNLKMNQRNVDMNHSDPMIRARALAIYKQSIDTAARLGARWARPLPQATRPDMEIHIAAYRELADYAATRDVTMLVENYGWMQGNPRSVVELVTAIGKNVFACPDIGNWNTNEIRYEALKETFPSAVSCDFKARELGPDGEHRKYDLRRCYDIGRQAGFKGPWCLEHAHRDRKTLFHDLGLLRDQLRQWMRSSE